MEIRSLGCRTDLMILRWDGRVDARDGYLVAETPASPRYYSGNFLLFPQPPDASAAERWPALFREAFAHNPEVRHVCLQWDAPDGARGEVAPFLADGYVLDASVVLTARAVHPPAYVNPEAVIRPLETDADWDAALWLQVATAREHMLVDAVEWKRQEIRRYRRLVDAGHGRWFGAFLEGQLAADLGVFVEDGVGRFQNVETAAAFRRRGLCGTLVYHAAGVAFSEFAAETLVMVADPEYHAARLYESVGFRATERQMGLWRRPAVVP